MELLSQPPLESDHLLLHGHNKTKDIPQFGKEKILSPRINLKKNSNKEIICINTASSEKGTTLKVANSEFQFFGYYVMGPYE